MLLLSEKNSYILLYVTERHVTGEALWSLELHPFAVVDTSGQGLWFTIWKKRDESKVVRANRKQ